MNLNDRKKAFSNLKNKIDSLKEEELEQLAIHAKARNGWFSQESITQSLQGISFMLEEGKLNNWLNHYTLEDHRVPKIVGIVMAGNIPLVGFHDLLCVLISGNFAAVKASSDDEFLTTTLIDWIVAIEPRFKKSLEIRERLTAIDAVVATGSDNTSRYFEYYFKDIPHIIRKNRTSVGVISGSESAQEIENLGADIFSYYGLGCRNVSKVFTPKGFDLRSTFAHFEGYKEVANHNKYRNNYDYHKSIYLVNQTPHLDTGFLLTTTTDELVSPISVLYHQEYENPEQLHNVLTLQKDKIQCIVGKDHIPFGQAQKPELWDYADGVDVMEYLKTL